MALSRHGKLRAGINLSNFLLVSSRSSDGGPAGVSPDMAAALAACLDLPLEYVSYENPGKLADAAERDEWDIGLVAAEPQRAALIDFTSAYAEIEATYLLPPGSPLSQVSEVDRKGHRIAAAARTAYGLWLERNVHEAEMIWGNGFDETYSLFIDGKLDALAGLRQKLIEDEARLPGSKLLEGRFMSVQQAIGTPKVSGMAIDYLRAFVETAVEIGLVAELIAKHGVIGLTVASREPDRAA
ncbi:transporter substrate-binding domain-containing protein [Bosea sp. UNC402CLCol]|uniref:transporter substrate-binding domain-containing protein n=1 Tax=Bosea sp. UNC402CLCol TaxID=1510531 RepID=UPI000AFB6BC8|nr:transporter substrate-binding domain-containing protein [Bosea sp. UNC402CLCol]